MQVFENVFFSIIFKLKVFPFCLLLLLLLTRFFGFCDSKGKVFLKLFYERVFIMLLNTEAQRHGGFLFWRELGLGWSNWNRNWVFGRILELI